MSRSSNGFANKYYSGQHNTTMEVVSDISTLVLKRDVKLQLTTMEEDSHRTCRRTIYRKKYGQHASWLRGRAGHRSHTKPVPLIPPRISSGTSEGRRPRVNQLAQIHREQRRAVKNCQCWASHLTVSHTMGTV